MKLAIVGKGGIGKSSICAGLALWLAEQGRQVWAVDADPNTTLGYALGWPEALLAGIRPLSEMRDMLAKRATGGSASRAIFSLAPPVADIIADFAVERNGISLMTMGTVVEAGGGCLCPENATLKTILRELVAEDADILVDMVAGLEHLGRGTAMAMHGLLAVTDATAPGLRSVTRMQRLAEDLGLHPVLVAANRVRSERDLELITQAVSPLPVVGTVSYHEAIQAEGVFSGPAGGAVRDEIALLAAAIDSTLGE